ncbi:MAG: glycine cleavage system aminomethyltransferase GcvT [Phycisphaerales bacterium JB039]
MTDAAPAAATLLKTPLHQFHLDHGARMVEYAGWEMPISYGSSIQAEHQQVRTSGGLFDVSHMGRVAITGRHARRLLERLCTRRISDMQPGQCRYSLVGNDRGGVRDDVLVYRKEADDFLVVVNASNRLKLLEHFEQVRAAANWTAKIDDQTEKTAMVAIQGPKVMDLISRVSSEIPTLKRYRFTTKNLLVMKLIVSRTGSTGEDGVEVILPAGAVAMALKLLLKDIDADTSDAPVRPAGLGARDTLRLEAGMPLYGHELGEEICALSCGVDFAISMDKDGDDNGEAFIGLEALRRIQAEGGPQQKIVGLNVDGRRTARQGMPVRAGGAEIGVITSGCASPTLGRSIAMALVDVDRAGEGAALEIDAGRATMAAQVTPLPFYKAPKK